MSNFIKDSAQVFAVNQMLNYIDRDPQEAFPKLLDWADQFDKNNLYLTQRQTIRKIIENPDNNWMHLINSFWTDVDPEVRKIFFRNFIVNASLMGTRKIVASREKYACNIPWAILMDPTSACNLKCIGCWAAEYGHTLNLEYEVLDDIIRQGTQLGTHMYIYSGGEPMVRKGDIIRLCEAHPDCMFLAFTNGTLIDEKFADEMLRVKNFVPAISIEGFEEATDYRRGKGTFNKVMDAMRILKEKKLLFGASCCYTSKNIDSLSSEEYIDMLVEAGAKFAWFFHYMPIGNEAVPELLPLPEQREIMYHKIREFRNTKPIFTIDFQHDGEYVKGCIAGGSSYLHINANGDIEPCAFIHYADSNIREHTLLEAYKRPLFMAYKQGQPFNENMLRPCPMLENPEALRDMVKSSGAHSTDMQSPENIDDLYAKCKPYADRWVPKADELWNASHGCAGCDGCGE